MSDLKYHRNDDFQEREKRAEEARNYYLEQEEKYSFSIRGQLLILLFGITFILEGALFIIRDGLFSAPALMGEIPDIILICMGCIFVFISVRSLIRLRKNK